jgi:hypothetical protein
MGNGERERQSLRIWGHSLCNVGTDPVQRGDTPCAIATDRDAPFVAMLLLWLKVFEVSRVGAEVVLHIPFEIPIIRLGI